MKNMKLQAMESMMGEEKPMQMQKRPKPEYAEEGGMESILVTPEEKAMIMAMREGAEGESEEEEGGMEKMLPQGQAKMGAMG